MSQTPFSYRTSHRFADVCEAFEQNFDDGLELGARFVAYQHGEKIIDIFGGWSDRKKENPWSEETLSAIYSTGKSVCTLLIAREVEAGRLEYDRPVSEIWPEFAAAGKQDVTLAQAMSHQAGLSGFDNEMDPSEWLGWDSIIRRIEQMEPQWAPGTASGYSPQVFGFVVGEIIRRTTGHSIGAQLRELHSADGIDVHCGLAGEDAAKGAHMQKPPKAPDLGDLSPIKEAAFLKPWSSPARVSREDWMAAEIPASNMHATADGLACLLQSLVSKNAPHALSPEVRQQVFNVRISGDDL
ncbi:MAG: serine hydrolase domain-containing protein, partial [Pseudomonadota bacterium]